MMKYLLTLCVLLTVTGVACKKKEVAPPPAPVEITNNTLPAETPPVPSKIMTPMESIKDLDARVDGYKTGANLSNEDIKSNQELKTNIIRGTFDLKELSILALDKNWEPLNEKDRAHFVDMMVQLLEKKAIFSKEQVKGQDKPYKITYLKEEFLDPDKNKSLVTTRIVVPSNKVDLQIKYKLKNTPLGWKIFDVIVDDASLVENYKFQFDTIISKYGFPDLITRMEKKLKEMK